MQLSDTAEYNIYPSPGGSKTSKSCLELILTVCALQFGFSSTTYTTAAQPLHHFS